MKKIFISVVILFCSSSLSAQVLQMYPNGFTKAENPERWKNHGVKVSLGSGSNTGSSSEMQRQGPLKTPQTSSIVETLIGMTFYDHQTNGSISNRFLMNSDGTLSAAWTFSPNAIQTTTPTFPGRGTAYNYWDGNAWLYPGGTFVREETIRTGFPNIVVTPSGKEMIISHALNNNTTDSNNITVLWRSMKGTGAWDTLFHPWGTNTCYTLSKACGGLTNEKVYMIFQGKSGNALSQTPPSTIEGYYGPLYFARSLDGGLTWSTPFIIPLIDSTNYLGFTGDSYSIIARGDTVAISYGHAFMDVGLLKSTDAGVSWTKKIIQLHPQPMYNINADSLSDTNQDGIADTILSNSGDTKVLIDNEGKCHVWFSAYRYVNDSTGDNLYTGFNTTDNLYYWNESMTVNNGYAAIAATQDFNGNGIIDYPVDTFTNCNSSYPFGFYGGGLTEKPSAGIDANGRIYLAYQALNEEADSSFHVLHKNIFMMTLDKSAGVYLAGNWTYPYNIVPSVAMGGNGEFQEAVFACVSPNVTGNFVSVLYQRDDAPGNIYEPDSCLLLANLGNSSDIMVAMVDVNVVGVSSLNSHDLFVSQNYPNPTTGQTYINIGLKKSSEVLINIYDITGRSVMSELLGNYSDGSHTIPLDLSSLNAGIYNFSATANGEKVTRKLILSK